MDKQRILLVVFLSISFLSCRNTEEYQKFCGFKYGKLSPSKDCVDGFELVAKYKAAQIESLKYKMHQGIFKEDTIIYRNGIGFFFRDGVFDRKNNEYDVVRVSAMILDTARTFVFQRKELKYHLLFIESDLKDSCVKTQFVWKNNIKPAVFTEQTLDSLSLFYKYEIPFDGQLLLKYYYDNGDLYYKVIEDHGRWQGGPEDYRCLTENYGNIYFDMEAIEKVEDWRHLIKRLGWE